MIIEHAIIRTPTVVGNEVTVPMDGIGLGIVLADAVNGALASSGVTGVAIGDAVATVVVTLVPDSDSADVPEDTGADDE